MGRSKDYVVVGIRFSRQTDLEAEVKLELAKAPLNKPFRSEFLAAVVNELHPDVIAAKQCSTGEFQYLAGWEVESRFPQLIGRFRGGKLLLTYFVPLNDWRDVTVYPWRKPDLRKQVKRALREKINPCLPRPTNGTKCSHTGCLAPWWELEYEHLSPTYDEIAEECLQYVTEDEINTKFGYNKFLPNAFGLADCIPDQHPAFQRMQELHNNNQWMWLCKYHHRNVGLPKQVTGAFGL